MMKLFIIGNGFDLKHGLKSNYEGFKKFVYKKNKKYMMIFHKKCHVILIEMINLCLMKKHEAILKIV